MWYGRGEGAGEMDLERLSECEWLWLWECECEWWGLWCGSRIEGSSMAALYPLRPLSRPSCAWDGDDSRECVECGGLS